MTKRVLLNPYVVFVWPALPVFLVTLALGHGVNTAGIVAALTTAAWFLLLMLLMVLSI